MALVMADGAEREATFHSFFERWVTEQAQFLRLLVSISRAHQNIDGFATHHETDLVNRVIQHYEEYYRVKTRWARRDVFSMLTPPWRSFLEDSFLWIGGWRPTMAFHLLYSKSGLQFEAHLEELVNGISSGDLGDLSREQLSHVDQLQRRVVKKEREITEELAEYQETVASAAMVELSHTVSEILQSGGEVARADEERIESILAEMEGRLRRVLQTADDLRLAALKGVVEMLSPIQAVHFLIAAAELHLRLHEWGRRRDAGRNRLLASVPPP